MHNKQYRPISMSHWSVSVDRASPLSCWIRDQNIPLTPWRATEPSISPDCSINILHKANKFLFRASINQKGAVANDISLWSTNGFQTQISFWFLAFGYKRLRQSVEGFFWLYFTDYTISKDGFRSIVRHQWKSGPLGLTRWVLRS